MENVMPSERLQAYADAVFSIIATLMVIPLAHLEDDDIAAFDDCKASADCTEWYSAVREKLLSLLVFALTFAGVSTVWRTHAATFGHKEVVPAYVSSVTALWLLPITAAMPVTARFTVSWPYSAGALLSFIGNVAVLFVLSILLATANSKTQASDTIGTWIAGIIALIVGIVTSFVLPRFCIFLFYATAVVSGMVIDRVLPACKAPSPAARKSALMAKRKKPEASIEHHRVEAFTDGVHAIVATLIVLDVKSPVDSDDHIEFDQYLSENVSLLVSAVLSLGVIASLWLNHQAIMRLLPGDSASIALNRANMFMCIIVSLIPFSLSVLTSLDAWMGFLLIGAALTTYALGFGVTLKWLLPVNKDSKRPIRQSHIRGLLKIRIWGLLFLGIFALILAATRTTSSAFPSIFLAMLNMLPFSAVAYRRCFSRALGGIPGKVEDLSGEEDEEEQEEGSEEDRSLRQQPVNSSRPSGYAPPPYTLSVEEMSRS